MGRVGAAVGGAVGDDDDSDAPPSQLFLFTAGAGVADVADGGACGLFDYMASSYILQFARFI